MGQPARPYQAASGAGASLRAGFISSMGTIHAKVADELPILPARFSTSYPKVSDFLRSERLSNFGVPLASPDSVDWRGRLTWPVREEWKGGVQETSKILGRSDIPTVIDGLCVRIGSFAAPASPPHPEAEKRLPFHRIEAILARRERLGSHPQRKRSQHPR